MVLILESRSECVGAGPISFAKASSYCNKVTWSLERGRGLEPLASAIRLTYYAIVSFLYGRKTGSRVLPQYW